VRGLWIAEVLSEFFSLVGRRVFPSLLLFSTFGSFAVRRVGGGFFLSCEGLGLAFRIRDKEGGRLSPPLQRLFLCRSTGGGRKDGVAFARLLNS